VDDLGHRLAGDRVPLIMSQLVVGDNRAVFVFAFGGSKIHAYGYNVYLDYSQALNSYDVCLLLLATKK